MSTLNAIGILGGTFDPIHYGHLRAALEIYQGFSLNELRLIPCKLPPHRSLPDLAAEERLKLVTLACQGTELKVDDRELQREGPSYTVDTLLSLRQETPKASLCLILGMDAFLGLPSWHQWEKIIQLANIIIMCRGACKLPEQGSLANFFLDHQLKKSEDIRHFQYGKIVLHNITMLDISASYIRNLIKTKESPRFLLPESVFTYIKQQGLYKAGVNQR